MSAASLRPRVGMLLGDPNGIGPEIAVKLLTDPGIAERADIVLYTDAVMIDAGLRVAGTSRAVVDRGVARLRPLGAIEAHEITPGEATLAGGRAALA
ncbi:MAG TPA: 4-hydroxythreonine-4-phosphate dehydrogenase PdxA, partial [Casimicrobiaceae bacterium]|nr:4-hydroxythreonine-4-phosphate dehydrogenase PdxA [Casimicrobiaceae bacterium]